jgi:hypothetical protein
MPNVINIVFLLHEYCIYIKLIDSHESKTEEGFIIHRNVQLGQRKRKTPRQRIPYLLQLLSSNFSKVEYTYGRYTASVGNNMIRRL